ncbi:ubiquitin carboxyl-terminal hydrolase 42-like isoform X2 [Mya arenaria]|uniref:ubiquitin carboxyl-terminal hydrolase 42-like isoform X2 n=1 Tax=Mya arenaria TaxID=6604 RepID=UPI0022DE98C5|nr:ubiquitin carboxyl-terminal hydrolase 42-like isoform X2 [Mya arenaria]
MGVSLEMYRQRIGRYKNHAKGIIDAWPTTVVNEKDLVVIAGHFRCNCKILGNALGVTTPVIAGHLICPNVLTFLQTWRKEVENPTLRLLLDLLKGVPEGSIDWKGLRKGYGLKSKMSCLMSSSIIPLSGFEDRYSRNTTTRVSESDSDISQCDVVEGFHENSEGWTEIIRKKLQVEVPKPCIQEIRGQGDSNMNSIKEKSGLRSIAVDRRRQKAKWRVITMRGSVKSMQKARAMIQAMIADWQQKFNNSSSHETVRKEQLVTKVSGASIKETTSSNSQLATSLSSFELANHKAMDTSNVTTEKSDVTMEASDVTLETYAEVGACAQAPSPTRSPQQSSVTIIGGVAPRPQAPKLSDLGRQRWSETHNTTGSHDPIGLKNKNGQNLCFANAALQCFLHTRILEILEQHQKCSGDVGCCKCQLRLFFESKGNTAEPILTAMKDIWPKYKLGQQEDSHEFILRILEQLAVINGDSSSSSVNGLDKMFHGKLEYLDSCISCELKNSKPEAFSCLSVSVEKDLKLSLRRFLSPEEPDLCCNKCKTDGTMSKKIQLLDIPEMLILHAKRFLPDGGKDRTVMRVPPVLKIQCSNGTEVQADLLGGICHLGETRDRGHYIAYVKCHEQFFRCDDDLIFEVELCAGQTDLDSNGYVFFYKKRSS